MVHGAMVTSVRASKIIEPSDGAGGGVPRPRKLSDASVSTAHDSDSVTCTMMIDVMLGSTCRNIVAMRPCPVLLAALTYSTSRSDSTGPRVTRMKIGT